MKLANYQLDELLEKINSFENVYDIENSLRDLIKEHPYVNMYMEYSVNDEFISVDIDQLKYEFSTYHRSMAGTFLCTKTTSSIFKEVLMNDKVPQKSKCYHLKSLLEMLHIGEAKILVAIIKKNLSELYPNITHELICKVL